MHWKSFFLFLVLLGKLTSLQPDWLSFAGGVFNCTRSQRLAEVEAEYKFHIRNLGSPFSCLEFLPLVGLMGNSKGGGYLYGGLNFDLLFFNHLVVTPGFALGYYWRGRGKNLGYPLEFRTGGELGWQFSDGRRLGIHFYHLSNAGLSNINPGEESCVIYLDIPITKKFPFN